MWLTTSLGIPLIFPMVLTSNPAVWYVSYIGFGLSQTFATVLEWTMLRSSCIIVLADKKFWVLWSKWLTPRPPQFFPIWMVHFERTHPLYYPDNVCKFIRFAFRYTTLAWIGPSENHLPYHKYLQISLYWRWYLSWLEMVDRRIFTQKTCPSLPQSYSKIHASFL